MPRPRLRPHTHQHDRRPKTRQRSADRCALSMGETLAELRRRYLDEGRSLPRAVELALRGDTRAGARAIMEALDQRRGDNRAEAQRLRRLRRHERALEKQGFAAIAGVDEAGMSPLAGPVVAGAAILPLRYRRAGIDDSKKLSAEQRAEL